MKFLTICTIALVACTAGILGSPIGISGNNVGDIVTIGVNLDATVNTKLDTTIVNVLAAILTHIGNLEQLPPPEQIAAALQQMSSSPSGQGSEGAVDLSQAAGLLKELFAHIKEPAQLKELMASEQATKMLEKFLKQ